MAAEEIFTTVNSRDLWRALTLKECLRFSPQFQLALKTGECELEYLLEHYRIASDLFYRASKAGETFASALQALGGGLLSILTPSTALPLITLDDETATETAVSRLKPLIKKLTDVSELTKTLAVNLYEPGVQLQTAAEQLEKLNPLRKAFSRAGEQLESTLNKSASVPRNRVVEAEEADSGLEDSRSTFSTFAHSYLSALRAGLGPSRLATCLRCTFITFRTESDYAQGLRGLFQPFDYQVPLDWRGELERLLGASEEDARRGADQASGPPVRPTGGVLIEGNLFKRSHKKHWRTWDRRWFMIANNQLVYFTGLEHLKGGSGAKGSTNEICGGEGSQAAVLKSPTDTTTVSRIQWKIVEPDLRLCTAKAILSSSTSNDTMAVQGQTQDSNMSDGLSYESSSLAASSSERRFTFELISPNGKKHYLQALNEEEMDQWVTILRAGLLHGDISVSATTLNTYQPQYRPGVPSPKTSAHRRSLSRPTMLFPQEDKTEERKASINFSRSYDCLRTTGGAQLLDDPPGTGNRLCADCASDRVSWASTNLGLTLCTDCAACHRGLGVHISKVRSLFLDNWEPELIAVMRNLGNRIGGSIFEASLTSPPSKSSSPTVSKNSFNNSSRDVGLLADVKRPQPGQGSASNKQVRQNWIEMKYAACRFVDFPGSSLADLKSRILDLYRNWRTQMQTASSDDNRRGGVLHDRSASPRTSVITVLSGPALGRVAKVVDRRRPSASPRLISRSQMFLDNLLENLDVVAALLQHSILLSSTSNTTPSEPRLSDKHRQSTHRLSGSQLAARLLLVAGAHMGCPPLVLLGLAAGASPCAQPGASHFARSLDLTAPRGLDPLGTTCPPLVSAVIGGRMSVCELLLSHGANIDETDAEGQTALHHACNLQRVHLVCLLLRKRANAAVRDLNGLLPIDLAYKTSNADIVTLLRLQPLKTETFGEYVTEVDETAAEVFHDFTARAYNLQWDSDADDYREIPR
uniref:Arf-GAP with coiled-coil, ANK repeat and PH domain-containing protein 2 n=1 Tax=Schistocephalus solidus TaxID=70667 RepID=A0A0V0JBI1_SCHSO